MTTPAAYVDLACARCRALVRVFDLNGAVVDGQRFIGGCCLSVKREPVPFNEFPAGYGVSA